MKTRRTLLRRIGTVFLALWVFAALIPTCTFEQSIAFAASSSCEHELVKYKSEAATCQHTGHKAYRKCKKCGAIFDSIEAEQVDYSTLIIPIADHKWDSGKVIRKPSASGNGLTRYTCTVCGTTEDKTVYYKAPVKQVRRFIFDGHKVRFKERVAKQSPSFMKKSAIDHVWLKAGNTRVTVYWKNAKNMKAVDGVIILRKTGDEKAYKEIKRLKFRKTRNGIANWDPKTSFADKTATKKNTPYTYIIVSYLERDGVVYISHCSDWASAQLIGSKLKTVYEAKINKKSLDMQSTDTYKLKLKYAKPKKTYKSRSFRWFSDNPSVASVSKNGTVTAGKPGTTVIRGRLGSGQEMTCTVSVVGAFTPEAPTLKFDTATNSSISMYWNSVKYATSYDLYRSDDGLHWNDPVNVTGTSKTVVGLQKGHTYTFYVVAVNDNAGYTSTSDNSNVIYQKAVFTRRDTTLKGFPKKKKLNAGTTFKLTVKIGSPDGRRASLQMKKGNSWVTQRTVDLPGGAGVSKVRITFPNTWWGETTQWRIVIPRCETSEGYTSKTLTITAKRRYQNPKRFVQIKDSIDSHGYGYYVSKTLVNSNSTKSNHIEALISTASKYKGDAYVNGRSGAPGNGVDASGLIIQACYGAGVDLWPISPSTRPSNCVPSLMNSKLRHVKYQYIKGSDDHPGVFRGDLIFFHTENGVIGHVAIYLGWGKIIHASMVDGRVETSTISELTTPIEKGGRYGYRVAAVRRIFN